MALPSNPGVELLPIVIAGPTGVGKSALAVELAEKIGGEVVNYDSVQIYRGFDIGSAKPTEEERRGVRHHLIDILDPEEHFDAAMFQVTARNACADIIARGKTPVLAGGTLFYLRAFLYGLPPIPGRDEKIRARLRRISEARGGTARLHRWLTRVDAVSGERIAVGDRHRLERALEVYVLTGKAISSWMRPGDRDAEPVASCRVALELPPAVLSERLDRRVVEMFGRGLVEETRALLAKHDRSSRPFSTIGYREAVRLIDGEITGDEALAGAQRRTRAYAKRQRTFLRAEVMHRLDATLKMDEKLARILHLWDLDCDALSSR